MIWREVKIVLLILIISFDFKSVSATSTKEGKTLPTFQNFPSVLQPTYLSQPILKPELPPNLRFLKPRLPRRQKGTVYILGQ